MPQTQALKVVERLLRLITVLQGPDGPWGRRSLADLLDQSTKTVSRDLDRLKAGGIPVQYDRIEQTYRIRAGFFMPPVDLTVAESVALAVLARSAETTGRFLARPAAQGIEKLQSSLPPALREELAAVMPAVVLDPARSEADDQVDDVWFSMSKAIANRRSLSCCYDAAHSVSGSDAAAFRFDPYALYFGQRAWYAIGQRDDREGLRTLRLSRFSHVQDLDRPYAIPDGFSLDQHLGKAWRMVRGDGIARDIVLRFTPEFADTAGQTTWHPSQQYEEHPDGSLTLRFRVEGLDEIVWWILGYGPGCEVLEPRELREKVAELAQATARRYREASDQPNARGCPSASKGRK